MFCPQCGENNADGVQFCKSCGRQLKAAPTPGMPAPGTPGGFQRPAGVGGVPGLGATNDLMRFVLPVASLILIVLLAFLPWATATFSISTYSVSSDTSFWDEITNIGSLFSSGDPAGITAFIFIALMAELIAFIVLIAGNARLLMGQRTLTNLLVAAGAGLAAAAALLHSIVMIIYGAMRSGSSLYSSTSIGPSIAIWFLIVLAGALAFYAFKQYQKEGK